MRISNCLAMLGLCLAIQGLLLGDTAPCDPFTITQPDGTEIWVRMYGDEHHNWLETLDGHVIIDELDGQKRLWWYYATLDDQGRFRKSSHLAQSVTPKSLAIPPKLRGIRERNSVANDVAGDATVLQASVKQRLMEMGGPEVGPTFRPIVFLVDFPGSLPGNMPGHAYSREQFAQLLFAEDLDPTTVDPPLSNTYTMSVADYYREISRGAFSVEGDVNSVVDWFTMAHSYDYYVDGDQGGGWGDHGITHSAAAALIEIARVVNPTVDFSRFDADGDGQVDCVILIMEGWASGAENQFWSYATDLAPSTVQAIAPSIPVDDDGFMILDGVIVKSLIVTTERMYYNRIDVDRGDIHPIGTFCHELGHVLGLPDLYDTGSDDDVISAGAGYWALMGSGNWNRQTSPAYMCAWSRSRMNWVEPEVLSGLEDEPLTVAPAEDPNSDGAYKLLVDTKGQSEYFLIENRQALGADRYLKAAGLLIWHINEDFTDMYPGRNRVNRIEATRGVDLIQADGRGHLYLDGDESLSNPGDAGDPYPGTSENTRFTGDSYPNSMSYAYDRDANGLVESSVASGVSITDITQDGEVITANVTCPEVAGEQIGYDEGNYEGYHYMWGQNRAGIVYEPDSPSLLACVRTYIRSSTSSSYVTGFTIRVYEGFNVSSGAAGRLVYTQSGQVNWDASAPERDSGWISIPIDGKVAFRARSLYYVEIQYHGSGYVMPANVGFRSKETPSRQAYWRYSEAYSCSAFDEGDWNIRVVLIPDESASRR